MGGSGTFIGSQAGQMNTTGQENTMLGFASGQFHKSGNRNTYIGSGSGLFSDDGSENTALGYLSGQHNRHGNLNVFLGKNAGSGDSTGIGNVYLGPNSGKDIFYPHTQPVITNSVAIGANTLLAESNTIVLGNNAAVGLGTNVPDSSAIMDIKSQQKGLLIPRMVSSDRLAIVNPAKGLMVFDNTENALFFFDGSSWVNTLKSSFAWGINGNSGTIPGQNFIGTTDSPFLVFKVNNSIFGAFDQFNKTISLGSRMFTNAGQSVFIGDSTGYVTQQDQNTFVGYRAGRSQVSGVFNSFFGSESGAESTGGNFNSFYGYQSGKQNITGHDNSFFGSAAALNNRHGSYNTFLGQGAGLSNLDGNDNIAIGNSYSSAYAGNKNVVAGNEALSGVLRSFNNTAIGYNSGASITDDSIAVNNTFLGYNTRAQNIIGDSIVNVTVIGANAFASKSNSVILGENANVGIGTSAPTHKLTVVGKTMLYDTLFLNYSIPNPGDILSAVDGNGKAVWVDPGLYLNAPEQDPQISSTSTGAVPRWDGLTLSDGTISDIGGHIGIGTPAITNQILTVAGKASVTQFQMTDGAVGGYVLRTDGNGDATWVDPSTLLLTEVDPQVGSTVVNSIPRWTGGTLEDGVIRDDAFTVGIGTAPVAGQMLTVSGKTTTSLLQMTLGASDGNVLRSDAAGNASWVDPAVLPIMETDPQVNMVLPNSISRWNGTTLIDGVIQDDATNVGIGTAPVPGQRLTVPGKTTTTNLQMTSGAGNGLVMQSDASGNASWVNSTSLAITESDPKVTSTATHFVPRWNGAALADGVIQDNATNVGVGTAPVANQKLTVDGKTTTTNLQMTTGAGNGLVLQSDASGNATWVNSTTLAVTESDPQVSSATTSRVPRWNGSTLTDGSIQDDATSVGIGTAPVSGQKLTVPGKTTTTNFQMTTGASNGLILQSDASGNASWVSSTSLAISETDPQVTSSTANLVPRWNGSTLTDGVIQDDATNVGVGTAPVTNQKLTVAGKTTTTNLQMTSGAGNGLVLQSDAAGNATWVNSTTLAVTESDPQVTSSTTNLVPRWNGTTLADGVIQDDATNIGVGTAPVTNQKLTVAGKTTTTNLQMISGAANGLVMQSDASGNATWINSTSLAITENDPQVTSSTTNLVPRWNGSALTDGVIQDDATNVGVGTTPVANQKLTVAGKTTTTNLQMTSGAGNGLVLQSDASGNGTWVNSTSLAITESDPQVTSSTTNLVPRWNGSSLADGVIQDDAANVGVGTAPVTNQKLTVAGKTTTTTLQMTSGAGNGLVLQSDASGNATWVNSTTLAVTESDPQVGAMTISRVPRWNGSALTDGIIQDDATNAGIGTAPVSGQKLTVSGKTTTTNLQMTTGAGANLVMQSDASGNASWVNVNTLNANNIYNSNGSLTSARTLTQGSNAFTILNNGTQNTVINLASTGDLDVQNNGVSSLFVDDAGRTGINMNTPLAGLHIKGIAASFDAHIRLESAGASTDYANILFDGDLKFRNFGATSDFQWRNSANNVRMVLQDDGDLGIGVSDPLTSLHVNGALTLNDVGNVTITADNQVVTVGNSSYLRLSSDSNVSTSRTIVLTDGLEVGQILFIECNETGIDSFEIGDSASTNTNTTGTIQMTSSDVIQLIWNGADWMQVSYSNN